MEKTASAGGKFGLIEIGRAVAAILVVFHHTGSIMREERFYNAEPFGWHLHNFNVGVDFFFVLSGFIIAWIHFGDIGQPGRVGSFLKKRFQRIYPPYWPILAFLILLYLAVPSAGKAWQHDPLNFVLSILLLPNPAQPVLGVAWTLTHEIFFYALFALVIVGGRRLLFLFPAWALAIIAWNLGPAGFDPDGTYAAATFPLSFFLSAFNLEFLMGVAAAAYLARGRVPMPWLFAGAGCLSFFAIMLLLPDVQSHALVGRLAFSMPATLFVLGAVEIERTRRLRLPGFLLFLGAASYSIYLVHPVSLSFLIQVVTRFGGRGGSLELMAVLFAAMATVVGILYHLVVEKNAIALSRRMFAGGGAQPVGRVER